MSCGHSGWVVAYIGLGGNLDDPAAQVRHARAEIAGLDCLEEVGFSSLYRSAPMGQPGQPDYINAVMAVSTDLSAHALLAALQRIEYSHGRVRTAERWGPRTLDLDLLIYGAEEIVTPELTVPHPGIADREFVLYPLTEIAPADLVVPGRGLLANLVRNCPMRGLEVLDHG